MIAAHSYHKMNWEVKRRIKERESTALLRKWRRQLRWMTRRKCMTPRNCSVERKTPKANPLMTRMAQSWLMLTKRWREHFQEVLNRPPPEIQTDLPEIPPLAIRTGPITWVEAKKMHWRPWLGKGEWILQEVLFTLLSKIWNGEDIPMDWKLRLLVKLPKGDLSDCTTLRGIMSLSIASKVLSSTILTTMEDPMGENLWDEQAEFYQELLCWDQITTLRLIIEQTLEWNTGLYMVFLDFEEAFDSMVSGQGMAWGKDNQAIWNEDWDMARMSTQPPSLPSDTRLGYKVRVWWNLDKNKVPCT